MPACALQQSDAQNKCSVKLFGTFLAFTILICHVTHTTVLTVSQHVHNKLGCHMQ